MRLDAFSNTYSTDPAKTWKKILGFHGRQVSYDPELDLWLIAGNENVRTALTDATRFSNRTTMAPVRPLSREAAVVFAQLDVPDVLADADRAQHTRIRAILRAVFPNTGDKLEKVWGARIADRVDQVVNDLASHDRADLMRNVAARLPLLVIADILGMAADELAANFDSADGSAALLWGDLDADAQLGVVGGLVHLWDDCRNTVTAKTTTPGDGLIGDLLRYRGGDDARLTLEEIAALAFHLTVAAWEATAGTLGHALECALTDRSRWARLADDNHYLATHVEESLRHSPAIDGRLRVTTSDVTLDNVTIPAGSQCLLLIGTANHDPRVFANPDRFDPDRAWLSQHLTFGAGPHSCIGSALARITLTTTLRALARSLPQLRLAGDYQRRFRPNLTLRSHQALPVITNAAGRCPLNREATAGERP
ncbi:cytochrome P450 [Actinoplanes sp. GCM10030250]|uniref:cytochrome P450 n=1 Tax=Actinoplanes sp. GCM10030250 TaxID=3273376 RepID=UPI00361EBB8D